MWGESKALSEVRNYHRLAETRLDKEVPEKVICIGSSFRLRGGEGKNKEENIMKGLILTHGISSIDYVSIFP